MTNKGWDVVKGSIFLKNRHFIIQERFNKLICGINTIIKFGSFYDHINTIQYINLLNLSWIKKCLFLRNMEPLNPNTINQFCSILCSLIGIFTDSLYKRLNTIEHRLHRQHSVTSLLFCISVKVFNLFTCIISSLLAW